MYMFRLYLEYSRVISPDRDNGKMVSGITVTGMKDPEADLCSQDFVLPSRRVGSSEGLGA